MEVDVDEEAKEDDGLTVGLRDTIVLEPVLDIVVVFDTEAEAETVSVCL